MIAINGNKIMRKREKASTRAEASALSIGRLVMSSVMTFLHHCRDDVGFAGLCAFGSVDESGHRAVAQDENPIGEANEFGKIVRDQQDRSSLRSDLPHQR